MTYERQHAMRYTPPYDYFNEIFSQFVVDVANVPYSNSETVSHPDVSYKKIPIFNEKSDYYYFYIIETKQIKNKSRIELSELKDLPDALRHTIPTMIINEDIPYTFVCNRNIDFSSIAQTIYQDDPKLGSFLLESYYQYNAINSQEVTKYEDNVITKQKLMLKYLTENKIEKYEHSLDFDTDDNGLLQEWFKAISEKEKNIEEFHYSTPFLMNGAYVISNSGSALYYIYKPVDENSGSWYVVDQDISLVDENGEENEDLVDFYYDSNLKIAKAISDHCNEWNLIIEVKDNIITKASSELDTLNLLQNDICDRLLSDGRMHYNFDYTLEYQIACKLKNINLTRPTNYLANNLEAFFEYMQNIEIGSYNPTQLLYRHANYYDPSKLNLNMHTNFEHSMTSYFDQRPFNTSKMRMKFSDFKLVNTEQKEEIIRYIETYVEPLFSSLPSIENEVALLKKSIQENSVKLKIR